MIHPSKKQQQNHKSVQCHLHHSSSTPSPCSRCARSMSTYLTTVSVTSRHHVTYLYSIDGHVSCCSGRTGFVCSCSGTVVPCCSTGVVSHVMLGTCRSLPLRYLLPPSHLTTAFPPHHRLAPSPPAFPFGLCSLIAWTYHDHGCIQSQTRSYNLENAFLTVNIILSKL
jgi:hypothetical protein